VYDAGVDANRPAVWGKFDGIVQQIKEHLRHPTTVDHHRR
jgi:hypothetical protein